MPKSLQVCCCCRRSHFLPVSTAISSRGNSQHQDQQGPAVTRPSPLGVPAVSLILAVCRRGENPSHHRLKTLRTIA